MRWPSGENAACKTQPVWPWSVASTWPLAAFHTRAVLSSLAVTIRPALAGEERVFVEPYAKTVLSQYLRKLASRLSVRTGVAQKDVPWQFI